MSTKIRVFVKNSHMLLLAFMLFGCTGSTPAPIVIGHVSDKTRADKAGDQAELGIRLALHELTQDGTIADAFGGRKIEVHHTDTRGKLDAFESQAVRLDSVNRSLAIFGGLSSAETLALNSAKAPLLTFSGYAPSGATSTVFCLGMSPARQGAALGEVIAKDAKAVRIAIIMDEKRPESSVLADHFRQALTKSRPEANPTILAYSTQATTTQPPGPDRPDRPIIVVNANPPWPDLVHRYLENTADTVVFLGSVRDFNSWHQELRRQAGNAEPQLIFGGGDGEYRLFDAEMKSVLLATALDADPANAKVAAFRKAFREAYPAETADVHAAVAYDGFRIVVDAMKRTSTQLTPEKLREELLKTKDVPGLTGPLTFAADRQMQRPIHVVRWQNGTLTPVKTFAP